MLHARAHGTAAGLLAKIVKPQTRLRLLAATVVVNWEWLAACQWFKNI